MRTMKIPYVTGSPDRFERLSRIASILRVEVAPIATISELERWLRGQEPGVVITDSDLADGGWRDALECCQQHAPRAQVLVTARTDSASLWAEIAEAGAADLIAQPFYAPEVRRCLRAVTETAPSEQLAEATI